MGGLEASPLLAPPTVGTLPPLLPPGGPGYIPPEIPPGPGGSPPEVPPEPVDPPWRGPEGPPGPQGPQGDTGPAGPQGEPGEDGQGFAWRGDWIDGVAYAEQDVVGHGGTSYIALESIMMGPGSDPPDVDTDRWGLFVQGAEGPPGPAGIEGPAGPQGPTGATGPEGATGPQGPAGPSGVQGPVGPAGPQGATGTGVTMQGSVATAGDLPLVGNTQGDAYIVQADDSLWIWDGAEWVSGGSIQGPPGATGPQGAQGPAGAQGPPGEQGSQGPAGPQGDAGAQGATGATGSQGPPGPGVAAGGTTGQVLTKLSGADYATNWQTPSAALTWPLYAPDGSALAPQYAFQNSQTTGLFRDGSDSIGFATNSMSRWKISAAGHLLAATDTLYDVGDNAGSGRPRDVYVGRYLALGDAVKTNVEPRDNLSYALGSVSRQWWRLYTGDVIASGTISGNGSVPAGGTTDQVLAKASATDHALKWMTPAGGGALSWPLLAPADTAAAPSYSWAGDTDMGLYRLNPDTIGLALGGGRKFWFEKSGTDGGLVAIGNNGATYIRNPPTNTSHLSVESAVGYLMLCSRLTPHLASNTFWDGTTWVQFDTAAASAILTSDPSNLMYRIASAGSPNAFGTYWAVNNAGLQTTNGIQIVGNVWPSAGAGLELNWDGTTAHVHGYNRTAGAYVDVQITGNILKLFAPGRIVYASGGVAYDPAWPHGFHGNMITDGRLYQQANGGAYCLDATDMSSGIVGSKVVQRSPEGYIYANYINMTADAQAGAPVYVAGQNGDGFLRWYPKAQFEATSQSNSNWTSATNVGGYYQALQHTAWKTGHAQVSIVGFMGSNGADVSGICQVRINGAVGIESSWSRSQSGSIIHVAATWTGHVNAGDSLTGCFGSNNGQAHYNNGGGIVVTIG